jgi:hypothetical protein
MRFAPSHAGVRAHPTPQGLRDRVQSIRDPRTLAREKRGPTCGELVVLEVLEDVDTVLSALPPARMAKK